MVLGCFNNKWPPYCADLHIMVYEDSEGYWVKVTYCNKVKRSGYVRPVVYVRYAHIGLLTKSRYNLYRFASFRSECVEST